MCIPVYLPPAQRFALLACGRDADSLDGQKMFGMLEMLKKPHRTHKSSAHFVRRELDLSWLALTIPLDLLHLLTKVEQQRFSCGV
jgi:hypothetical protein